MTAVPISDRYRDAIRFALAWQFPMAVVLLLLLDGGQLAKVGGVAMGGFWAGVAVVVGRRPTSPTRADLAYVRIGGMAVFAAAVAAASFKAAWLGH